jgi:hypothetical protein
MHSPSTMNSRPAINSPWSCLEPIPGLIALPCVWRARLGEMFERVRALILQANATPAELLPCPRGCSLAHDIVCRPDGSLAATCYGDPERPFEIPLTPADITPLEVSWSKLARAHGQRHLLLEGAPAGIATAALFHVSGLYCRSLANAGQTGGHRQVPRQV